MILIKVNKRTLISDPKLDEQREELRRQLYGEAFKRLKQSKTTYTPTAEELKVWNQSSADARKALRGAPFNPEIFDRIVKK